MDGIQRVTTIPKVRSEKYVRKMCWYFFVPRQQQYVTKCEQRVADAMVSLNLGTVPEWLKKAEAFKAREGI